MSAGASFVACQPHCSSPPSEPRAGASPPGGRLPARPRRRAASTSCSRATSTTSTGSREHAPVIVIGRAEADAVDRVHAFRQGCDDYVPRPFDYQELVERIHAVLRRARPPVPEVLEAGAGAHRHPHARRARRRRGGSSSRRRSTSCSCSSRASPSACSRRTELLHEVWDYRAPARTRTLDSHASRLRRKLREAGTAAGAGRERVGSRVPAARGAAGDVDVRVGLPHGQREKAQAFRRMHREPPILVLPNAWDVASAKALAALDGCRALATSSAAVARSLGFEDGERAPGRGDGRGCGADRRSGRRAGDRRPRARLRRSRRHGARRLGRRARRDQLRGLDARRARRRRRAGGGDPRDPRRRSRARDQRARRHLPAASAAATSPRQPSAATPISRPARTASTRSLRPSSSIDALVHRIKGPINVIAEPRHAAAGRARGARRRAHDVGLEPRDRRVRRGGPDRRRRALPSARSWITRAPRPRVTYANAQRVSTSRRFWKPTRYTMWMPSHSAHARKPLTRTPLIEPTARARPIVASSPLSLYGTASARRCGSTARRGGPAASRPERPRAAPAPRTATMSPNANTSGCPATRQVGLDDDAARRGRPPLPRRPRAGRASGEAATPAAQTFVRAAMRSPEASVDAVGVDRR